MRIFEQHETTPGGGATASPHAARLPAGALAAHAQDLLRFARRRVRDEALAEDAVQDALVAALAALPTFEGNSSLKTWLLGILAHKIKDAFRSEARYVALPDDEEGGFDGCAAPAGHAAHDEDQTLGEVARRRFGAELAVAVARLPASLREVFELQAIEGVATGEVCRRLGISEGNCWVRLHRARRILSSALAHHY